MKIQDSMLYTQSFTEEELITNIDNLTVRRVLQTQKNLSVDFVCKYILNPDYHVDDSDSSITVNDVIHYQPHLEKFSDVILKTMNQ